MKTDIGALIRQGHLKNFFSIDPTKQPSRTCTIGANTRGGPYENVDGHPRYCLTDTYSSTERFALAVNASTHLLRQLRVEELPFRPKT